MNRLVKIRLFAILIAIAACISLLGSPAEGRQDGVYVVTVAPSAAADGVEKISAQLAATYGGTLAKGADAPPDAFVLRISAEQARVLAADPRVISVAGSRFRAAIANATEVVNWTSGVSYTYDGAGNIGQIGNDKFVYDDVGRLVEATVNSAHRTYTYDAFGNRTACTQFGPNDCQAFTINTAENKNRIGGAGYDAAGNVTSLSNHVYSYDPMNMMTRDTNGSLAREFVYTADDERIATHSAGASWNWTIRSTDGKVLREFTSRDGPSGPGTASWQWAKDYVWRDGLLLASRQPDGTNTTTYHYHLDHLGTPRRITDQDDRIVGVHDYLAFGPELSGGTGETSATALKYTGHERDTWSSGSIDALDYMHARYYSPWLGRFLSVDKGKPNSNQPQSWNRYLYALDNPIGYIDTNGQEVKIAVAKVKNDVFVHVKVTVELSRRNGKPPTASEYRDTLKRVAQIFTGTFAGDTTMHTSMTIDAIFTKSGETDRSRHQIILDPEFVTLGHTNETKLGGSSMTLGNDDAKWIAHELGHNLGLDEGYDDATDADKPGYEGNLMNDDSLSFLLKREQWLEILRAYREGELNQGIKKP